MKSDLYSYSYGNNDNMVEITVELAPDNLPTKNLPRNRVGTLIYLAEDEILEIAEKIKAKKLDTKNVEDVYGCSHCANRETENCDNCRIDRTNKATNFKEKEDE